MKYIIDLPDNCSWVWVRWIMTSDKDGHAYFDFKQPRDLTPLNKELEEAYEKGFEAGQHEATTLEYQQGLDDAWETAKQLITKWVNADADDVFEDKSFVEFLNAYTASEAIAKIKAYEEQQKADDEIKVGDEVTPKSNNSNWLGVVVGVDDTNAMVMTRDGYTAMYRLEILKKTDRHFPQVAELFKAMKEGAE